MFGFNFDRKTLYMTIGILVVLSLMSYGAEKIFGLVLSIPAVLLAITIHEFGHAYSAYLLGDDTAKMYGRMTLNPAKHLDIIGLISMLIFRIGWAKPVPVNPNNFKNYKVGNIIVSLAGVAANIITAIICVLINKYVNMYAINEIAYAVIIYNVGFASFNLLPINHLEKYILNKQ